MRNVREEEGVSLLCARDAFIETDKCTVTNGNSAVSAYFANVIFIAFSVSSIEPCENDFRIELLYYCRLSCP